MSNADLVHITGAGTCIVVPSQSGNIDYVAASDKEHAMTINQAATTTILSSVGTLT